MPSMHTYKTRHLEDQRPDSPHIMRLLKHRKGINVTDIVSFCVPMCTCILLFRVYGVLLNGPSTSFAPRHNIILLGSQRQRRYHCSLTVALSLSSLSSKHWFLNKCLQSRRTTQSPANRRTSSGAKSVSIAVGKTQFICMRISLVEGYALRFERWFKHSPFVAYVHI